MKKFLIMTVAFAFAIGTSVDLRAQDADVVGGQTSVLLDTATLSSAAGLNLSGTSPDVGAGNLGEGSVAFTINTRDNDLLPTTFSYTPGSLEPFVGTIEHTGSVFFNDNNVEVGNFTIGFNGDRVGGANSGFFVESTTGVAAVLFDVGVTGANPEATSLLVDGSLLVSPEFANFLGDTGLTGAEVGSARIEASAIPEPGAAFALSLIAGISGLRRKRS
jgi:hypothetical protein